MPASAGLYPNTSQVLSSESSALETQELGNSVSLAELSSSGSSSSSSGSA
jgi:hypothetical protein